MPLQIRRGTDAERTAMTQPLAAGELIFVTNTNRLYIGMALPMVAFLLQITQMSKQEMLWHPCWLMAHIAQYRLSMTMP